MARRRLVQWRWQWRACVLLPLLSIDPSHLCRCDAQLLSAYEQAYGPWSINIHKNVFHRGKWQLETRDGANGGVRRKRGRRKEGDGDLQLFFPEMQRPPREEIEEVNAASSGEDEQMQSTRHEPIETTTKHVRSVSCILHLEKNGRFALSIDEDMMQSTHSTSPIHQSLTGEWFLTPNPYCVTDRHYDTLLLVSELRMRRRAATIEKATVELRCKIWGRYGAGPVRKKLGFGHGRACGRMTHGTILIVKEQIEDGSSERKLPTREVVGTFRGRTIVDNKTMSSNTDADELLGANDQDDQDFGGDSFDEFGVLRPLSDDE
ncbi:hypothetical protein ACHAXT_007039 [Thalassiosira profunda]